jgi:midasin (ATPase involved in ribosome maturation)
MFLRKLEKELLGSSNKDENNEYVNNDSMIGVKPFLISKLKQQQAVNNYAFDAQTTKVNLLKLLRSY